jgi:PAS domain S-box-containing protein
MAFKIRNKLLIAFIAILLPFLILTIINHYHQRIIYNATHEVHTISEEIQKVAQLQFCLNKAIMSVNDYLITGDKIYIDNFKREMTNIENELKELKEIESVVADRHIEIHRRIDEENEIIRDVENALKGIEELSNKIFEITSPVGNKDAARFMEELDYKLAYPAMKKLDVYHEIEREDYREAIRVSDIAWNRSLVIRITGIIIVIGLSIFFALFYSRIFVSPIKQVHNGADAIAKGDFKVRLDISTGDEIEQLSKAMNEMAKQLDTLYLNMGEKIEEGIRKFAAITESANDAIIVLASPDIILFWNKKAEEMFGYSADEVIEKGVHELIVPQKFRDKVGEGLRNFFKTGQGPVIGKVVEVSALRRNGTELPVELSVSAVRIGEDWQAIGIIRDITEKKRAEDIIKQERDFAELYLDIAGVMIVIIDKDEDVSLINKKGCEVLRCEVDKVIGRNWFDMFIPERERSIVRDVFRRVMGGKDGAIEYFENHILRKDGEERLIAWHNTVIKNSSGEIIASLSSGEDITERKKIEDALKKKIDELEQFRKVTIKRELRMEELKRKNKELENELKILRGIR